MALFGKVVFRTVGRLLGLRVAEGGAPSGSSVGVAAASGPTSTSTSPPQAQTVSAEVEADAPSSLLRKPDRSEARDTEEVSRANMILVAAPPTEAVSVKRARPGTDGPDDQSMEAQPRDHRNR